MAITIDDFTIAQQPRQMVGTHAASAQVLATNIVETDAKVARWNEFIDGPLIDWGIESSPLNSELRCDDLSPPKPAAVSLANRVANILRDNCYDPPTKVVPNGDGGIIFEWHTGATYRAIEVDDEENVDLSEFQHGKLVSRERM